MSGEQVYVSETVLRALVETAEAAGVPELSQVIAAATWVFFQQDEAVRECVVQEYCLRGPGNAAMTKVRKSLKERIHELVCYLGAPFGKRAVR
jgi:hypothetical protein